MKKYNFPSLTDILTVKVGTKYVWEDRVRQQAQLVHLLEDVYGIKLNIQAFSFYPNYLYFGQPISSNPDFQQSIPLWDSIQKVFSKNRWKVYSAYQHVDPHKIIPKEYDTFDDLGFDHIQLLLSEAVLMDLNHPSFGVGEQLMLSLFQPLIGFAKSPPSRMVLGRPGSIIIKYQSEDELLNILNGISKRKSFSRDPFYVKKISSFPLKAVFKGKICLNSYYNRNTF